jgi:hypothetical protein
MVVGGVYCAKRFQEYRRRMHYESGYEEGFVASAYKSWKEKFCAQIEFTK